MSDNPYRLPRHVVPGHYDIRLELDLEALTFEGEVSIDIEVGEKTDTITLNAAELEIGEVTLGGAPGAASISSVTTDEKHERAVITLDDPIEPGPHSLRLRYTGVISDQLRGLYASVYRDAGGNDHLIATSQCQATDARRILPCWDEPDFKATFETTMVVPDGLEAYSNTPEVERRRLEDGRRQFEFAPTMKMSTYLLAFIAGPFEATDAVVVRGTPIRIIVPKGNLHLTDVAMENAVFCFEYLTDYYGIRYPGDKLDHIAIPDFAAGAMENVGLITYRDAYLIIDEDKASQEDLQRSLDAIGHETAHQWFGNLVTLAWWEGTWLNEAFASFMELKATDAMRPEWKRWLAFAETEISSAMGIDQLVSTRPIEFEVSSPNEVDEMFDIITYGKGSAVLRMIETFIGEEPFRAGVGGYLRTHEYGNTVTPDLWKGLDAACDWPVSEIMATWVYQRGFPRIEVSRRPGGIRLSQRRFLATPDETDLTLWKVPIQLKGSSGGRPFEMKLVLEEEETDLAIADGVDWVVANAGGHGFYRTSYTPDLFEDLLSITHELDGIERHGLVSDTLAFVRSGGVEAGRFLDLVQMFQDETEHAVWSAIVAGLGMIEHHALEEPAVDGFRRFVRELIGPVLERLGWEPEPDETDLDRKLRGTVIAALGNLGEDADVISKARSVASDLLDGLGPDPEVATAALSVYAHHGAAGEYSALWEAYEGAATSLEKRRFLSSVAAVRAGQLPVTTLDKVIEGAVRTQDGYSVFTRLLRGDAGPDVWLSARGRWDEVLRVMPGYTRRYAVSGLPALSQPEVAADVEAFFAEHPMPEIQTILTQRLELLTANVNLRTRETPRVTAYFLS